MSASHIDLKDVVKVTTLSGLHYPRQLQVSIDDTPVGVLAEAANLWRFTYSSQWLSLIHI